MVHLRPADRTRPQSAEVDGRPRGLVAHRTGLSPPRAVRLPLPDDFPDRAASGSPGGHYRRSGSPGGHWRFPWWSLPQSHLFSYREIDQQETEGTSSSQSNMAEHAGRCRPVDRFPAGLIRCRLLDDAPTGSVVSGLVPLGRPARRPLPLPQCIRATHPSGPEMTVGTDVGVPAVSPLVQHAPHVRCPARPAPSARPRSVRPVGGASRACPRIASESGGRPRGRRW